MQAGSAKSGPGGKRQVSTDGGQRPLWRADGRELFYRSGEHVMAVPVTLTDSSFSAGTPHELFRGAYDLPFDATHDGGRFLMIKGDRQTQPNQINVIVNWTATLKK